MSSQPTDLTQEIILSIYLRRDTHENGMTLKEYADSVIDGTQSILDHAEFDYQFSAIESEIELVKSWAVSSGLTITQSNTSMAMVKVKGVAGQFNTLFNITLQTIDVDDGTYHTHDGEITIPNDIKDVILGIYGLNNTPFVRGASTCSDVLGDIVKPAAFDSIVEPAVGIEEPSPASGSNSSYVDYYVYGYDGDPQYIHGVYGFNPLQVAECYNLPPHDGAGGSVGVIGFSGGSLGTPGFYQNDLSCQFGRYGMTPPTINYVSVSGGSVGVVSSAVDSAVDNAEPSITEFLTFAYGLVGLEFTWFSFTVGQIGQYVGKYIWVKYVNNIDGTTTVTENSPPPAGTPGGVAELEMVLDLYVVGMLAPKSKITMYCAPGTEQGVIDIFTTVATDTVNCPSVLNVSYTFGGPTIMAAAEAGLQACVVKGITVVAASGDRGSMNQNLNVGGCYPITSPYALVVGGTSLLPSSMDGRQSGVYRVAELAWRSKGDVSHGQSSGGFSVHETRPNWQDGLTYIPTTTSGGDGSATALPNYRAIPDMCAPAACYNFDSRQPASWCGYTFYKSNSSQIPDSAGRIPGKSMSATEGTSASAPFITGMILRLNLLLGRRLGNINSTWYAHPEWFTDITEGNNIAPGYGYSSGYACTAGWDAVTGLGAPNGTTVYAGLKQGVTFPKANVGSLPTVGDSSLPNGGIYIYPRKKRVYTG